MRQSQENSNAVLAFVLRDWAKVANKRKGSRKENDWNVVTDRRLLSAVFPWEGVLSTYSCSTGPLLPRTLTRTLIRTLTCTLTSYALRNVEGKFCSLSGLWLHGMEIRGN